MTIEELIKQSVEEAVAPLREQLDLILSVIIVRQKDAGKLANVSDDIIRRESPNGHIQILQRAGSRLNYLTLKDVGTLAHRPKRSRR